MQPGQERIYYVIAESLAAARASPAIERLKERGIEVLLLAERIDEWVMGQVESYEGKRFKDAARGDLELGGLASDADRKQHDAELKESKGLLKRIKDALGERVSEVRVSERLQGVAGRAWCSASTICPSRCGASSPPPARRCPSRGRCSR